jgi:ribosomal protein L18
MLLKQLQLQFQLPKINKIFNNDFNNYQTFQNKKTATKKKKKKTKKKKKKKKTKQKKKLKKKKKKTHLKPFGITQKSQKHCNCQCYAKNSNQRIVEIAFFVR